MKKNLRWRKERSEKRFKTSAFQIISKYQINKEFVENLKSQRKIKKKVEAKEEAEEIKSA